MKAETMLWAGIVIGPAAWFLDLEANFALASIACSGGGKLLIYLVSGVALTLALLAGGISFVQWRVPERNEVGNFMPHYPRRQSLALAGMGLSGLFFLAIAAQSIPNLLLAGCE